MKLFAEYLLVDRDRKFVLRFGSDTSSHHMLHMRDVYSVIYRHLAPLHIAAVDVLGELHVLDLDRHEAD
jgi:hypothetical protein